MVEDQPSSSSSACLAKVTGFVQAQQFLIMIVVVILVAFVEPSIALSLAPSITASYIAVIIIFLISGVSLKTEELSKAVTNFRFNIAVQVYNLAFLTLGVYGAAVLLDETTSLDRELLDGIVICAALPMTVNMVIVLTKSANGDEASAVFNAALGNLLGVFVTPLWIIALLGHKSQVNFVQVLYKLTFRVLIPLVVGQLIHNCSPTLTQKFKENKPYFKKLQEIMLVFIVFCVFSRTFKDGTEASVGDIFATIGVQFVLLVIAMGTAWLYLGTLFPSQPKLRVMGLFGCTHKTVAMGIPLLGAIYTNDSRLGLYSLPLLVWHPMQLVLGSFLAPYLASWVDRVDPQSDNGDKGNDSEPFAVTPSPNEGEEL